MRPASARGYSSYRMAGIFHELRRDMERESQQEFYERILKLMAQMGGGSANVL